MQKNPLIVLSIELRQGCSAQLVIYNESDPQELALDFVQQNDLPISYVNPIKQNIIKQMCLYDVLKNNQDHHKSEPQLEIRTQEKENKSPQKQNHRIFDVGTTKKSIQNQLCKTPERKKVQPQWNEMTQKKQLEQDTDKEFDIYERLYQHSKALDNKKYLKYQQEKKIKDEKSQNDPNLTFKPVINNYSRQILQKKALRSKSPTPSPFKEMKPKSPFKSQATKQMIFIPKSPRLEKLCQQINPQVKISILDNQHSFSGSSNQSISELKPKLFIKALKQPVYTEDQIENSFSDFMRKEFQVNQSRR